MAREIKLTKGKFAIVDDDVYEYLSQWKWQYTDAYAVRSSSQRKGQKKTTIPMQNEVLPPLPGLWVDHINLNKLDNRRGNLRLATKSQNSANRGRIKNKRGSRYKGVTRYKPSGIRPWTARVVCQHQSFYLGTFDTEESAAKAYDKKARELFGEFAGTNFIEGFTGISDRTGQLIPENGALRIELFEIVEVGSVAWHRGNWWAVFPTGYPLKLADAAPYCEVV